MPEEQKLLEVPKTYECVCRKCAGNFISANELDTDGDALCLSCKEKAAKIAEQVQKIIDQRRANRPPVLPRVEPLMMPGTNYVNARNL